MSRRFIALSALALAAFGCGRGAPEPSAETVSLSVTVAPDAPDPIPVAPMPREARRLPVAPMPRAIDEDLTHVDIGLDPKIEAALPEIDRVKDVDVAPPVVDVVGTGIPGPLVGGSTNGSGVAAFPGRTGSTKTKLIREMGGNADSERAVALALAWLAKQQKPDGGWQFETGEWKDDRVAATGLALLPFLGAGCTHKPGRDDTANRYQKAVADGIAFLKKACPKDGPNAGKFDGAATATAQALAALALCEVYGMTRDADLRPFAQAAINAVQKSQAADGGWSDAPGGKSDITVVGWQVQALQAAKLTKSLTVDDQVIRKMTGFLNAVASGARRATYGTTDKSDAKPGTAATAVGLLCRYYTDGWGPYHPGMVDGVAGLTKNAPDGKGALRDTLYFHHATRVIAFYDGEEWKTWNEGPKGPDGVRKGGMRDWLVNAQARPDNEFGGSWGAEGEWGKRVGRLGTTALNALTLEVYYRQLPMYKRDGGGAKLLEDK